MATEQTRVGVAWEAITWLVSLALTRLIISLDATHSWKTVRTCMQQLLRCMFPHPLHTRVLSPADCGKVRGLLYEKSGLTLDIQLHVNFIQKSASCLL